MKINNTCLHRYCHLFIFGNIATLKKGLFSYKPNLYIILC